MLGICTRIVEACANHARAELAACIMPLLIEYGHSPGLHEDVMPTPSSAPPENVAIEPAA